MSIKSQIPNAITLGNLFCGLLIVIASFELNFTLVIILASIALVLDFLDGTAARLLKVKSEIGKDLDSLADMVSFGVAPAMVLYNYWSSQTELCSLNDAAYFALLPAVFAAYRLAVFNNQTQSGEYFKGLATPALALLAFAVPLAAGYNDQIYLLLNSLWFMVLYALIGSYFLLSKHRLISYKVGSNDVFLNRIRIGSILGYIVLLIFFKFFGIILCLLLYLIISLTIQKRLNTL